MATNIILAQRGGACVCVCIEFFHMSSRKRGSPSAIRQKAATNHVAKQVVLWPRAHYLVGTLYHRYANEVQWPQGAPDSVKQNWAHVMAQALAPLHSATGRRHSRPLVAVAMQHCKHVMAVATQHHRGP